MNIEFQFFKPLPERRFHPSLELPKYVQKLFSVTLMALLGQSVFATTAEDFDIDRYSTMGAGMFETFYVKDIQSLGDVLAAEIVSAETLVLVTETGAGKLALIRDQMSFHHIAQGSVGGKDWMATF